MVKAVCGERLKVWDVRLGGLGLSFWVHSPGFGFQGLGSRV